MTNQSNDRCTLNGGHEVHLGGSFKILSLSHTHGYKRTDCRRHAHVLQMLSRLHLLICAANLSYNLSTHVQCDLSS